MGWKKFRRAGCLLLAIPCALLTIPVALFALFISLLSPPLPAPQPHLLPADFMRGITFESWWNGEFATVGAEQTLSQIVVPTGADWIAVVVKCFQATRTATEIVCMTDDATASDDELRHIIDHAHSLGLKVMLKPHVDLRDLVNSSDGRFNIGFGADEAAWAAWFASYTDFITHYAELANELGVDYFVVGTELGSTTQRADDWREVVAQVRGVYDGPLTYAALTYFEPLQIAWWDELDAIGIDAYFMVTLSKSPTPEQMRLGWLPAVSYIEGLSQRWNMPVIITEVGYMSVDGTNILPGDWSLQGEIDGQEQADAYRAVFEAFGGRDWWQGVFWWSLSADAEQGGPDDRGYSFHDKPAEAVLTEFFGGNSS